jgi:hypothetical protein
MVRGPGPSRASTVHTTDHRNRHIFYMARGHVANTHLHLIISPDGVSLGIDGHSGQMSRMYVQGARPGTFMAAWLHNCALNESPPNPPNATAYPTGMEHVRPTHLICHMFHRPDWMTYKCIYWVLHTMAAASSTARPLRIVTMYPNYDWSRIWPNLHTACFSDTVHSTWYMVLHDILPTKDRLTGFPSLIVTTVTIADRLIPCPTA